MAASLVDIIFLGGIQFQGVMERMEAAGMLELTIDSIRVSPMNYQRVVILKDKESDRYLPIWIGPAEADAIAVKLQDLSVPRPLTHDLLQTMIDTLGGSVKHILVNDLQNDTFYAKIVIQVNGDVKEIDSRPSDAMALAVRTQVPIFAEESVMEKAGILLDKETGKPIPPEGQSEGGGAELKEEELRRMSAFTDFINDLDLEDFGRQQSGGS